MKLNEIIRESLNAEMKRQQDHIELIASENYVSEAVLIANGSIFTNKYAEGYPGRRYYGGCLNVDKVEQLGIDVAKKLFDAEHVNIQPHSGSQANAAAYKAFLKPGDKVLAMDLRAGGHLSHGFDLNFSGEVYEFAFYGVNKDTYYIDFEEVRNKALEFKPNMILAGASAYSREIDFNKFREIADEVGAYLMVDMAHIAGLVAGRAHSNPCPIADVVTTTTHKTLRGARGGMIFCKQKFAKKVDSAVFPGVQGGPLEHLIAGKTQALIEASDPSFLEYANQVVKNSKALCKVLMDNNIFVLTNGTDNHLLNIEVKTAFNITGKKAEAILESIGIVCNKELLPFDTESSVNTSGLRLGTAAMTTRGFKEKEFEQVGRIIVDALNNKDLESLKKEVKTLCDNFPIYNNIKY
ncbi:serine hydroxymethyltransferase [Spiroplasma tabanidicola]|uniref:Serine hydroxymethyltransferase n=1 Tax=Spiroplasma tabanidicola TaxID=324079 RepID=A0A6I6C8R2_9MOLU|nr:serine hydroxymethyltransferase [Spiroplasma tabanidicola]QGS52056.1 glycine hydroxymethyltransferase [Spiroplasma tabanidicola]